MVASSVGLLALLLPAPQGPEPLALASRRELFVDRALIESMVGARLEPAVPRDEGEVLRFDRPWEGPFSGYATVIDGPDLYMLYYRGLPTAGADGSDQETTCVAVSADGLTWERPALEFFEVRGAATNNVVLADAAPVTHNFSPFLDRRPDVVAAERFKALGGNHESGLMAYVSPDGLAWTRLQDDPVFTEGIFDSQNVAFWSEPEQCYLCYFRTWTGEGYSGIRTVSRTTSPDFRQWTEPEEMSFGEAPMEHLYTNQTHPYFRAPHLYVGIAARFMPGRQVLHDEQAAALGVNPRYFRDCSDAVLLTSRGGSVYDRTFLEGFLRPGIGLQNWVSRSNYPALNIVQTGPAEMSFYVNQNYAQPTASLHRYSLRLDGLASVRAGRTGGELTTRPLTFVGTKLLLNFATSAAGGIRVEVQDVDGQPLPGFELEQSVELIGNEIERQVRWRGADSADSDLGTIEGRLVRLRFRLVDADLYAMRFGR